MSFLNAFRPTRQPLVATLWGKPLAKVVSQDRITQPGRRRNAPGACLLIYGGEFAGQSEFVSWVLAERKLPGRTSEKGQPPVDFDAGLLSSWVQAELGLKEPGGQEVQTPEDLAGRIAAELQSQALYFVLDEAQRLLGGVAAFHEPFWLPLYKRLLAKVKACEDRNGFRREVIGDEAAPPIVAITSNREKRLPEPFLRRCLYIRMKFPFDETELVEIVKSNTPDIQDWNAEILTAAIQAFKQVRGVAEAMKMQKLPATDELIDWTRILYLKNETTEALKADPKNPMQCHI